MAMATRWSMEDRILAAVAQEAADIKEECIQAAVKDFEKKVREVVGKVAINVADFYSIERVGTAIHVKIDTGGSSAS